MQIQSFVITNSTILSKFGDFLASFVYYSYPHILQDSLNCVRYHSFDGHFPDIFVLLFHNYNAEHRLVSFKSKGSCLQLIPVLKCYCDSFHLVAKYACATLSKTDNWLIHDVYIYFKLLPNCELAEKL